MVNHVQGLDLSSVRARPQRIPEIPREVVKLRDGDYARRWPAHAAVATTIPAITAREDAARSIRDQNRLDREVLLVIDGCCKDRVLENLWQRRHSESLYELFRREEPCLLIAPDMSVYPSMSPCHHLYQLRRTFLMYAHFQSAGLTAVPFVAPCGRTHASHIALWLRANEAATHVAASFQTLQTGSDDWQEHLRLLEQIDRESGRPLAWVLIGQGPDADRTRRIQLPRVSFVHVAPKFRDLRRPALGPQLALLYASRAHEARPAPPALIRHEPTP